MNVGDQESFLIRGQADRDGVGQFGPGGEASVTGKPFFARNSGNGGGYVGPPIDLSDQVVSGIRDVKVAVGGTGQIVHPVVDRFRCLESVAGKAVFSISRKNAGLAIGAKKENSSSFVFGNIRVALTVKGQSERVGRLGRIQNHL